MGGDDEIMSSTECEILVHSALYKMIRTSFVKTLKTLLVYTNFLQKQSPHSSLRFKRTPTSKSSRLALHRNLLRGVCYSYLFREVRGVLFTHSYVILQMCVEFFLFFYLGIEDSPGFCCSSSCDAQDGRVQS